MKELEERLLELVNQGVDFAQEEIPLVAQEFITWKIWESLSWGCFFLLAMVLISYLTHLCFERFYNHKKKDKEGDLTEEEDDRDVMLLLATLLIIILFVCLGASLFEFLNGIKAIIAPRVYILEYLADKI